MIRDQLNGKPIGRDSLRIFCKFISGVHFCLLLSSGFMRQVNMFQASIIINIIEMGRMMSTSTKGLLIEFHLQRWDHKYVKHCHRNTSNFPTNIHRTGSQRVTGLLTYKLTSTTHHFPPKSNPINRTGPLDAFENILRLGITVTRATRTNEAFH